MRKVPATRTSVNMRKVIPPKLDVKPDPARKESRRMKSRDLLQRRNIWIILSNKFHLKDAVSNDFDENGEETASPLFQPLAQKILYAEMTLPIKEVEDVKPVKEIDLSEETLEER